MQSLHRNIACRIEAVLPFFGDGVYPSPRQFWSFYRASYKLWASMVSHDSSNPSIVDSLLNILQRIPAFRAQPSKSFSILVEPYPLVKLAFEWVTTTDSACDKSVKRTYQYQKLARSQPVTYNFITSPEAYPFWPGLSCQTERASFLPHLWVGIPPLLSVGGDP